MPRKKILNEEDLAKRAEERSRRRETKRHPRMRVTGTGVRTLQRIIEKRSRTSRRSRSH